MNIFDAPEDRYLMVSEQTLKAIDGRRAEIAAFRGTVRNVMDQLACGAMKDPYHAFRDLFKDVAGGGGNWRVYIDDLNEIARRFETSGPHELLQLFQDGLADWHTCVKFFTERFGNGGLKSHEYADAIAQVSAAKTALDNLQKALMDKKNEVNGLREAA